MLGRIGLVMLGSQALFIVAVILFTIGITLQAGAMGAVKTVKMTVKLVSGRRLDATEDGARTVPPGKVPPSG